MDDDDDEENQDDLVQDTRSSSPKDPSQDPWHGEEMYVFLHGVATYFSRSPREQIASPSGRLGGSRRSRGSLTGERSWRHGEALCRVTGSSGGP